MRLRLRPGGFSWISVCGRILRGWYVLDLDATLVTCTSRKEGAAGTFRGSFGHHPLGAWVANTAECVALLLRPGNAAANDVADHKSVLRLALAQLPLPAWSKLLVRIDGAAFSHGLLERLQQLSTRRRWVRWVTGWASTPPTRPPSRCCPRACGTPRCGRTDSRTRSPTKTARRYQVAELTGVRELTGWPMSLA